MSEGETFAELGVQFNRNGDRSSSSLQEEFTLALPITFLEVNSYYRDRNFPPSKTSSLRMNTDHHGDQSDNDFNSLTNQACVTSTQSDQFAQSAALDTGGRIPGFLDKWFPLADSDVLHIGSHVVMLAKFDAVVKAIWMRRVWREYHMQ